MEKIMYDAGVDDVLEIIDSRIEYYDCLMLFDKAGMVKFEIIGELEILKDMIKKIKYY